MNPGLEKLHPYPFEKMRALFAADGEGSAPPAELIDLSIGEPKHPTPAIIVAALKEQLDSLSSYPKIIGEPALREAIGQWLQRRFGAAVDPGRQILPVNGTREALFAIAQCLIDSRSNARVMLPNPGYQIYEGAALLAGARPDYLSLTREHGYQPDYASVTADQWQQTRLLYLCSPGNPCGAVASLETLQTLIELSLTHGFVIAADECYSEIYTDEQNPPPGLLEAATAMGHTEFRNCLVFHSLSKRSNVPGLRSGFVAGDERLIEAFRQYRTYHGCAMAPPFQAASITAWNDERHVQENRQRYREKFSAALKLLPAGRVEAPAGGFYLWLPTPGDDQQFARELYHQQGVKVVPGSFLGREQNGFNPGGGYIRCALVAEESVCDQAIRRICRLL
ncbi:MAG: succinyldiaminopimelate transaminase [Gammaproteobacteria bacterium]